MPRSWRNPGTWAFAAGAWALAALAPALRGAPAPAPPGLGPAVDHLAARQDGSTGGFGSGRQGARPAAAYTAWAAIAVGAAGEDATAWRRGGPSLAAALRRSVRPGMALGDLERAAVAGAAIGLDVRRLGGADPVAALTAAQAPDGSIGGRVGLTAWGVLALRAAGLGADAAPVRRAAAALEGAQGRDGGWGWAPDATSDPSDTASAVQALASAGRGRRSPALARARAYLRAVQGADGGFPRLPGEPSEALTTAWVASALAALGERPDRVPWARDGGPLALLRRTQSADGGLDVPSPAPVWLTAQAVLALSGRPLPLRPAGRPRRIDHAPTVIAREPDRGGTLSGPLIVQYRDDPEGTGVDPAGVRLAVAGRDVTGLASITPFGLQLDSALVPAGAVSVRLEMADRAGNTSVERWRLVSPTDR
jgi:hypothetical protein